MAAIGSDAKKNPAFEAIKGQIPIPPGVNAQRVDGLILSMLQNGRSADEIRSVVEMIGEKVKAENRNATFDQRDVMLAGAAANAAASNSALKEMITEHVIRDVLDDAIDAIAGFKCSKEERLKIKQAIKEVKHDMRDLFKDTQVQTTVGTAIVAGGAALAKHDPKQIPDGIKAVNDATKEITNDPVKKQELENAAHERGASGVAEYLHDHSAKLREHLHRANISKEDFVSGAEKGNHSKALQHALSDKSDLAAAVPTQPHGRPYRQAFMHDKIAETPKPSAAALKNPSQKYAGLPTAPSPMSI